jgi:threonine dehydrogenase-like Zn-dependent dehydrogenase
VQGEVVISRMYGNTWHSVISQVPRLKEISVHHNGVYYSEEPARGGRARGDWQQTIDYLARGDFSVEALQPLIIDLDDLAHREDVAKTFADIPMSSAKVVLRIHGDRSQARQP